MSSTTHSPSSAVAELGIVSWLRIQTLHSFFIDTQSARQHPEGDRYLTLRDELGTVYNDQDFTDLFSSYGQSGVSPWRLALICVMQFMEDLPDRQAAEAVRSRIDWKYALSLELGDPGFDFSVLCEFRTRLIAGNAEQKLLDRLLDACKERG